MLMLLIFLSHSGTYFTEAMDEDLNIVCYTFVPRGCCSSVGSMSASYESDPEVDP